MRHTCNFFNFIYFVCRSKIVVVHCSINTVKGVNITTDRVNIGVCEISLDFLLRPPKAQSIDTDSVSQRLWAASFGICNSVKFLRGSEFCWDMSEFSSAGWISG